MKAGIPELPHISHQRSYRSSLLTMFFVLLFLVWAIHMVKPLFDPDFYWHLKTGCWIWDHRALPMIDPFSIPPQPEDPHRARFMLTSYWLFQLMLCAFYKIAGFGGILVFRFILATIIIAVFYRFSVEKKLFTALVAGIGITQLLEANFPERPQFISFICCALLLSLIFTHLAERRRGLLSLLVPLCLTMLLWANTHGGFILGDILLLCILLAEAFKFIHPKLEPVSGREYLNLAVSICSAMLISILNPNHIYSFEMIRSYAEASSIIHTPMLETSNLYEYYKEVGGTGPIIAVCTYLFTLIIFFNSRGRTNITWIGLLLLLGYMGLEHIRYYTFFLIAAILFSIRHFDTTVIRKVSMSVIIVFLITVVMLSLSKTPQNLKRISQYGWIPTAYFPVKVCDYLIDHGIEGNVFTTVNWGGYVLWRVAPQRKIFIDGRLLDLARTWEYFNMDNNWKKVFDKYDIRVVILPTYDAPNKLSEFTVKVEMDPEWQLVDRNNNGSLFVRKQLLSQDILGVP